MDAARSAAVADQLHAALLRRCWPPPDRENPALTGISSRAHFSNSSSIVTTQNPTAAQENFARAARIDREADHHLSEGRGTLAEFLANRAEELRAVPA